MVEESLKFHRNQHAKIEALQSSIESLFTERDAILSELNEWRQCLCMPPRQAAMDKNHLTHQSNLLLQQGSSETNSMLVSEESMVGTAWSPEVQLNHPYTSNQSCDHHHDMPANGVINAPDSAVNRSQPSATLQPMPCFDTMSDPSTMDCSMQFNETRPAPYGSIAHPIEAGSHEFFSVPMNHPRPPD